VAALSPYERLWFGKSIRPIGPISPVRADLDWNQVRGRSKRTLRDRGNPAAQPLQWLDAFEQFARNAPTNVH
jgi:hypothetical protein